MYHNASVWCHNGDEFTLPFLEPSDISKFFFSPKSSRYQSWHVLLKPQAMLYMLSNREPAGLPFQQAFTMHRLLQSTTIMTYLLFQILRNIIVALTKTDMIVILYITAYFKKNAIMPIIKINIYITGTLNWITSSEWDKTLN